MTKGCGVFSREWMYVCACMITCIVHVWSCLCIHTHQSVHECVRVCACVFVSGWIPVCVCVSVLNCVQWLSSDRPFTGWDHAGLWSKCASYCSNYHIVPAHFFMPFSLTNFPCLLYPACSLQPLHVGGNSIFSSLDIDSFSWNLYCIYSCQAFIDDSWSSTPPQVEIISHLLSQASSMRSSLVLNYSRERWLSLLWLFCVWMCVWERNCVYVRGK